MSMLSADIEKALEAVEPEDALHIERVLREMLKMARRKAVTAPDKPSPPFRTQPRALGLKPGLNWLNPLDA